jgi:amino acid adenylation domain-containing protein
MSGKAGDSIQMSEKPRVIRLQTALELTNPQLAAIAGSVPGGEGNVEAVYPTSPLQQGMLLHTLVSNHDPYVLTIVFELESRTNVKQLHEAVQQVIDRHETLRTALRWAEMPQVVQVVYRRANLNIEEIELTHDRCWDLQLSEMLSPERCRIDIAQAPLVRLRVFSRSGSAKCFACLGVHHVICDHQSLQFFVEEVLALLRGQAAELPMPLALGDLVARTMATIAPSDPAGFFRTKLRDFDEPSVPFQLFAVRDEQGSIEEAKLSVDPDLALRLRAQHSRSGVSPARVLHAAWAIVVAQLSGRGDVVFGTVLATAKHADNIGRTLGMAVNTLPLRVRLQELDATELLTVVDRELSELRPFRSTSLALAQRCSGVPAGAPLFTTLFNYRRSEPVPTPMSDARSDVVFRARGEAWTNYPIVMIVDDSGEGLTFLAQTDRRIEPTRVLKYFEQAVHGLVESLERAPQTQALSISLLSAAERRQLLEAFNSTHASYPRTVAVHQLFEEQVARTPDALAVQDESEALTYSVLNARANRLARHLRGRGVGAGCLVAVCMERSVELIVSLLGIMKSGAAYVPIDPGYPSERLAYMVEDAAPRVFLTLRGPMTKWQAGAEVIALDEQRAAICSEDSDNLQPDDMASQPRLAYVIYTSGSTGRPKGVMVEHGALVNFLLSMQRAPGIGASDCLLAVTTISFDIAALELYLPLLAGAKVVVASREDAVDATRLINLIEKFDVTVLQATPATWQLLVGSGWAGRCSLKAICGGEALRTEMSAQLVRRVGSLWNLYGPTETTIWSCGQQIVEADDCTSVEPIGRPIANTQVYILDGHRQPVPIGVVGEIYIGGDGVARGYLNRPELTAERFVADPFSTAANARMYKTGDLGRWRADGTIEYLGRNDHQVKIRGFRIELGEIESRLARHEQVKEAVVLAREDAPGEKRLVAYVVAREPTQPPSVEALRTHVKEALPEHMTPSAFVLLEKMPLTPNGKLDRRALPAPELGAYITREYEAPQGEVEEILAGIWQSLLRVERVGRQDNFFELGGHSLLIVQMMERLRRVGLSTELRKVFDSASLAELASALGSGANEQYEAPPNLIPAGCEAITPEMLPLVELQPQHIERIVQAVPGGAANVQDIYPLVPLQEGILFHHLFDEQGGDTYVLPMVLAVSSRARLDELIAALQAVIDRHEVLRTAVLWEELPRPLQVVYRRALLPVKEASFQANRSTEEQLQEWMRPERQRLDLRQAPLLRLQVAEDLATRQCYALLQLHHITMDRMTLEIVTSEVVAHLEDRADNLPASLPYRNHVAQSLAYARKHDAEAFFRSKLQEVDEPTAPFGLLDVHGDGSKVAEAHERLEAGLVQRIRAQARRQGVSAATLFHAAWGLVTAHTSGRDDIVFGSVLLGRLHGVASAQRILGMFVNTLPLRLQLRDVTARELVEHTQRELVELLTHEQASLAAAQRCSGVAGTTPLFTTLFNYRYSLPNPDAEWSSAWGVQLIALKDRTNYPITLSVDDVGDGFVLVAQTDESIEPSKVVGFVRVALQSLVEALEQAPQTPALSLSVLSWEERQQLFESFNASSQSYPRERLIHELFEEQVERTPHEVAVSSGGEHLTYRQLDCRANQLARYLRERGAGPERFVGLCVERGIEMVVGLLGILKSGGAYVPLDPNYPQERLQYMLEDTTPIAVLTQEHLKDRLPAGQNTVALDTQWSEIAQQAGTNPSRASLDANSSNLAYVIYTSGSTGRPKGVAIEHRNAVNMICWAQSAMSETVFEQTLQSTSLNFDLSVYECFVPLVSGGSLRVVQNALALASEPQAPVTLINTVPSAIASLLDAGGIPASTRVVNLAGEALKKELVERIFAQTGVECVNNLYGPSETTTYSTWISMPREQGFNATVGRPIANTQVYILDGRHQPVPIGVVGEIYIGGDGVARGYLNRPELTAERFVADPFSTAANARMYRTGDLGRWRADGTIEYLGRNDHQVKIRGFRIELGEIESRLARHEQVKEAVVLAREDVPGEKRLVAYVVAREPRQPPSVESLRTHVKEALPEHMTPSAFVLLERMPLTPNGKLDRRALPAPELGAYITREYEAPQGEVEEILAGIWQSLLRVERVGRQDNFFELGGHSLLIVQMMERLRRVGLSTELRKVFDSASLAELASALGSGANEQYEAPPNLIPAGCEAITPEMLPLVELQPQHIERIVQAVPGGAANVQDIYPLVPLQEGILFHHLFDEQGGDTYVLPMVLAVSSRARLDELIAALQAVIDRHEVLRTAVLWEELPRPLQVVYRQAVLPVKEVSFQLDRSIEAQLQEWMRPERQRLDLRQAPLLRLQVAEDLATRQCYALLQLHHITIDHMTLEIVTSEIVAHLEDRAQNLPASLPYRNHVAQSLAYARKHDAEAFFRSKLQAVDEPTAPFGLLDIHGDGSKVAEAHERLEAGLVQRIRAQARRQGVSAATLFHAAWGLVTAHTSGRDDIVFGSVLLGRLQGAAGAQRILGMFINTLPLRLQLREVTAKELVEHAQRELVELLTHEQASLAAAQRCSGVAGTTPLFTTLFNYRHSLPNPDAEWSGARDIRVIAGHERTNYPVTFSVDDLGDGFALSTQTDHRIDPLRLVGYLRTALESLVGALEQAPQTKALSLSIVPESERLQLLEAFNPTQRPYPQEQLVHTLFEEQVARTPEAIALEYREHSLTYAQLNRRANQLAGELREAGVGPDTVAGICLERGIEMIVAVLATLKAGGAYLPLDPSYPQERLQYMLQDAAPKVVLIQEQLRNSLHLDLSGVRVIDPQSIATASRDEQNLPRSEVEVTADHLVYLIYTSGSTGRPKGTGMPHRAMVNLIEWHRRSFPSEPASKVLQFAALSFDVAFQETFSTLCTGGALVLLDEWVRRDARSLIELLSTRRVERLFVPPLMLQSLAECYPSVGMPALSLRDVITAGEQLRVSPEIAAFFAHLPGCQLHNHYGPTETHVVTALSLGGDASHWPLLPSIGAPIDNARIYILDERGQPAPFGVVGEVYIGGVAVARGYLGRTELTQQRFLPDPFSREPQARMYRTGDLGRWLADGTIEYLGRNDHQVKIRGFRIELGEIEARLATHPKVKEAVALAREDVPGDRRLVAYVVPNDPGSAPNAEELRAHLKSALAEYMVPSAFVTIERVPLTPSGKLDRRALPAPEQRSYIDRGYEEPQGEVEEILAEIWRKQLRVERVGRHDDFFELGGHSLLVMKTIARVESQWSIEVSIRSLFERSTLSEFAAHIDELRSALLLDRIAATGEDIEDLLQELVSMPESRAQELLQANAMERK